MKLVADHYKLTLLWKLVLRLDSSCWFRCRFLGKRRMKPFANFTLVFWLYTALQNHSITSPNFLVFHTTGSISLRLAAFPFFIFACTSLSSSWVNCCSFMMNWLIIIFETGLSVTLGEFPGRFLKCSFHMYICFSWLTSFSLALGVLFHLLITITVCSAIRERQSSTEFLILLILSSVCSICSFWYALVSSHCDFLCFCAMALDRYIYIYIYSSLFDN